MRRSDLLTGHLPAEMETADIISRLVHPHLRDTDASPKHERELDQHCVEFENSQRRHHLVAILKPDIIKAAIATRILLLKKIDEALKRYQVQRTKPENQNHNACMRDKESYRALFELYENLFQQREGSDFSGDLNAEQQLIDKTFNGIAVIKESNSEKMSNILTEVIPRQDDFLSQVPPHVIRTQSLFRQTQGTHPYLASLTSLFSNIQFQNGLPINMTDEAQILFDELTLLPLPAQPAMMRATTQAINHAIIHHLINKDIPGDRNFGQQLYQLMLLQDKLQKKLTAAENNKLFRLTQKLTKEFVSSPGNIGDPDSDYFDLEQALDELTASTPSETGSPQLKPEAIRHLNPAQVQFYYAILLNMHSIYEIHNAYHSSDLSQEQSKEKENAQAPYLQNLKQALLNYGRSENVVLSSTELGLFLSISIKPKPIFPTEALDLLCDIFAPLRCEQLFDPTEFDLNILNCRDEKLSELEAILRSPNPMFPSTGIEAEATSQLDDYLGRIKDRLHDINQKQQAIITAATSYDTQYNEIDVRCTQIQNQLDDVNSNELPLDQLVAIEADMTTLQTKFTGIRSAEELLPADYQGHSSARELQFNSLRDRIKGQLKQAQQKFLQQLEGENQSLVVIIKMINTINEEDTQKNTTARTALSRLEGHCTTAKQALDTTLGVISTSPANPTDTTPRQLKNITAIDLQTQRQTRTGTLSLLSQSVLSLDNIEPTLWDKIRDFFHICSIQLGISAQADRHTGSSASLFCKAQAETQTFAGATPTMVTVD